MAFRDELAEYFPRLRQRIADNPNLSEMAVARAANMHPTQLSRYLNHGREIDVRVDTILRIEDAFLTLAALTRG